MPVGLKDPTQYTPCIDVDWNLVIVFVRLIEDDQYVMILHSVKHSIFITEIDVFMDIDEQVFNYWY